MDPHTPKSPFDPFEPSPRSADFQTQLETGETDEEFFFEAAPNLAPMPDVPPPPPPFTPPRGPIATIAELPEDDSVGSPAEHVHLTVNANVDANANTNANVSETRPPRPQMPDHMPPPIPSSKRKKPKKKKKKDKKKSQKTAQNGGGRSYSQYNSISSSSSPKSQSPREQGVYYEDDGGENKSPLLKFCVPEGPNSSWAHPAESTDGSTISRGKTTIHQPFGRPKVNTGELNSAAGEGTTVPQILSKFRFFAYVLSGLTVSFELYAMFFNILFLQADKFVLGFYLLFFVAVLLLFEIVRGDPVPASDVYYNSGRRSFVNVNINNATEVADIVWRMALEQRWARQVRYFLQDNFGILYSGTGRGVYLCIVGSLALGQGFIIIEIIGACFMLMGLWTIYLSFRFPSLEKALIMDLEHEFGNVDHQDDASGSAVTWSSVKSNSSSRSEESRTLLQR